MKNGLLKTRTLLIALILSNYSYSQATIAAAIQDNLIKREKRHAIVIEGFGKSWGATISYEYQLHENFSTGIGYGTSPFFFWWQTHWCALRIISNRKI